MSADRYSVAAIVCLVAFAAQLAVTFLLDVSGYDPAGNSYLPLQILGAALTLFFVLPGVYLWITGFTRFESWLRVSFGRAILYVAIPILCAAFLQLAGRYEQADT
jgi:hypothetical protein